MAQLTASNPFGAFDVGEGSAPALADMDGDGDLDAVSGEYLGSLKYFKNTGSAINPVFTQQTGAYNAATKNGNPFNGLVYGNWSTPALGDIDNDGDFDLVVGETNGTLKYYKNTGSATAPAYTPQAGADNPFGTIDIGLYSAPTLADDNGDGRLDLFVGTDVGTVRYYRNTGSATIPAYTELTGSANPLNGFDVGVYAVPALGDMDGDGDLDAIVGGDDGALRFFRNTGTATSPVYSQQTGALNPFNFFDGGDFASPAIGDLDGDGDVDVVSGEQLGTLYYFRNGAVLPAVNYPSSTSITVSKQLQPALGDVDGDGDLDLVVGNLIGVSYFKNMGTATNPVYTQQTGADNPFGAISIFFYPAPALGDVDSDGDLDLVLGQQDGPLLYYKNTGTVTNPVYAPQSGAANPWGAWDVGSDSQPAFGDVDGDGDLDLVVGEFDGTQPMRYFKNTGSATSPAYTQQFGADNPFNGTALGGGKDAAPALGDVDGDGDLDLALGEYFGVVSYFKNTGSPTNPVYVRQSNAANPWVSIYTGKMSAAALGDVDGDGDLDTVVGGTVPPEFVAEEDATLLLYRANRVPILDNAIPNQSFSGPGVFSYTVPTNTYFDLDNNALTYTATLTSGTALPAWLSFNAGTRSFSGNPPPSQTSPIEIRFTVSDGQGGSTYNDFRLFLDNVDDAPNGLSLSKTSVSENQFPGIFVATMSTTDPDSGDSHAYTLVSGTGSTDNAWFTIFENVLKTAASFDFEAKSFYSIRLRSTDAAGLFTEKAFTIDVTNLNEAPSNIALTSASVYENRPSGTAVGAFSTTDPDIGDTHSYSLVTGTGSIDNASFTISGNTLTTAASFDYKTKSSYSIRVKSADAGGLFTEKPFTINVLAAFSVINDADSGNGSLRQAVINANGSLGMDSITFDPAYFNVPRTIVLTTGELGVTDSVAIAGPVGGVTVSGNTTSRVFNLLIPDAGSVTISDLTVTAGKTDMGAGIKANDDNLTLTRCTVSNNTSTDPNFQGGGVSTGVAAGTWTFTDSTFSGNTGGRGGAIYFFTTGTLNMLGCTVSGNKATNVNGGGGLYNYQNTATIINSTFSGNQSAGGGGAIQLFAGAIVTVRNSTITGNTSATAGGGINQQYGYNSLTLSSTIVAGNTAGSTAAADLGTLSAVNVGGDNNLIGVMDPANNISLTGVGNLTGTASVPLDAKLGALAENGGPTMTHALLAGSIALNKGNNVAAHTTDQRGTGFNRVVGSAADIGAYENQTLPLTVAKVEVNDGSSVQRSMVTSLKVTFSEPVLFPSGINAAFQLNRTGPGNPTGSVSLNVVHSTNSVTITFDAGGTVGIEPGASLQDGAYQLVVFADKIISNGGQTLDGDGNGLSGDNYSTPATGADSIFRLYGDSDGNRTVNQTDFIDFRNAFNAGPSLAFDYDGDSQVNQADFILFRNRFNLMV